MTEQNETRMPLKTHGLVTSTRLVTISGRYVLMVTIKDAEYVLIQRNSTAAVAGYWPHMLKDQFDNAIADADYKPDLYVDNWQPFAPHGEAVYDHWLIDADDSGEIYWSFEPLVKHL